MAWSKPPRLLSEKEVAEIRNGLHTGMGGPWLTSVAASLLADHDARVARETALPAAIRNRYLAPRSETPEA